MADTIEEIRSQSGRHFDPRLVELFLGMMEEAVALGAGEPAAARVA